MYGLDLGQTLLRTVRHHRRAARGETDVHEYELRLRRQIALLAMVEFVFVHISFATRRATVMPDSAQQRLAEIQAVHAAVPRPAFVGRAIGLAWKPA